MLTQIRWTRDECKSENSVHAGVDLNNPIQTVPTLRRMQNIHNQRPNKPHHPDTHTHTPTHSPHTRRHNPADRVVFEGQSVP